MTPATPSISAEQWRAMNPWPAVASWSGGVLTVTIRIPDSSLSPNSRCHWSRKAKAAKAMREAVARAVRWWELQPAWKAATFQATFHWPDKRHRDDDNAMASLKSARDGLADAGVVVNDRVFTTLPASMLYDKARPRVEIIVREIKA